MDKIEVPLSISIIGIPLMSLVMMEMAHQFFGVDRLMALAGVPLLLILALVAANSTALTSTTPVGATSKITQLFYGLIQPGNVKTNIATASITAEVVSNASNLLMDIKPGYMLGAKPRQQAIGHVIGIFAGALFSVPLFFLLFTSRVVPGDPESLSTMQSDQFPMPAVTIWKGVAEVLSLGFGNLSPTIVWAVIIAAIVGLVTEVARIVSKGKFPLSPVGLGLAFVLNFQSSFAFFLGAFFFWVMGRGWKKMKEGEGNFWSENVEPICAGLIAGAALIGILDAVAGNVLLPWLDPTR
jgi:uncharacterized oligopeptide transporter (OPT) family protein